MIFRQLLHEERSCASYLVGCSTMGVAAVIDPQGDASRYTALSRRHGLRITDVIETHLHADHRSSARDLAGTLGAALHFGSTAQVGFPYEALGDGGTVRVGNRRIEVIHTPGHTPEHICLLVDDWFVLTGDTLFVGDVGRVDLALEDVSEPELRAKAEILHASLERLLRLPDHVEIYPGHYAGSTCGRGMDGKPSSTIGRERRRNRALLLDREAFVAFQLNDTPEPPGDFRTIKQANAGLQQAAVDPKGGGRSQPRAPSSVPSI